MRSWISRVRRSDEGAAAVEFALVWCVFGLLLIGVIQFGAILSQYVQLSHAAREGARWASLRNPIATVQAQVRAASPFAAGSNITVSLDPTGATPGQTVVVTVTRAANTPVTGVISMLGGGSSAVPGGGITLRARAAQRVE